MKPLLAMLSVLCLANAHVIYVGPGGYPTIQQGLNATSTDDTVLVAAGTYYEHLIWPNTHGIDLISESGPNTTIIDGGGTGRVIVMETSIDIDSTTMINGFTIRNGYTGYTGFHGGGILCSWDCSPRITNNIITDNRAHWGGGGIYCHYDAVAIIADKDRKSVV